MAVVTDPLYALLGFAGIIILLLVLITKFRWHVFLALLIPILLFALIPGTDIDTFINAFEVGFGRTLGSIGVVIVLGATMGEAMKQTGAVQQITRSMIRAVGRKRLPLALTLTGFVLGIAIFGDVAYVIINPLIHAAAFEFGAGMGMMATGLVGAMQLTHAVVPPTPGPLAAASLVGADIGLLIFFGSLVSFAGAISCWIWAVTIGRRIPSPPSKEFVTSSEDDSANGPWPTTLNAYLPIVVPILLIGGHSIVKLMWPEGNLITQVLQYLGWPVVALSLGLGLAIRQARSDQKARAVNEWVQKGLTTSAMIFGVTGLGGTLSAIIEETPAVDSIAHTIIQIGIPSIVLPFLIGVMVNMVTGSSTVGVITAASLSAPLLPQLGLSPEAAVLAAASGSVIIKYVNSSYFWVCTSLSRMRVESAILAYGGASLVGGLTSFAATYLLWYLDIL